MVNRYNLSQFKYQTLVVTIFDIRDDGYGNLYDFLIHHLMAGTTVGW